MDGAYMHRLRIYRANRYGMKDMYSYTKDHVTNSNRKDEHIAQVGEIASV
jgi:hypothetical protein